MLHEMNGPQRTACFRKAITIPFHFEQYTFVIVLWSVGRETNEGTNEQTDRELADLSLARL